MKTVRPDEFASPYSEDSIISIASRSDNQMSFLLSTIDYIDDVKFVDTLGIYRFFGFSDWIRLLSYEAKIFLISLIGFDF